MRKGISILSIVFLCILSMGGLGNATTSHSGRITTDETWSPEGNPHVVHGELTIQEGATLTILPGVEVKMDGGKMRIGSYTGKLIARGTESQKIKFTSNAASPQPGDWGGIVFHPDASDDSIIEHAIVEYGGGGQNNPMCQIIIEGTSPTIRNCVIKNSLHHGMYISEYYSQIYKGESTSKITGCRFEANGGYGIDICDSAPVLDANEFINNGSYPIAVSLVNGLHGPVIYDTNTYSGNNPDQLSFIASLTYNYTLRYLGIPYHTRGIVIRNDSTLTIEPGVEMRFDPSTRGLIIGTNEQMGKLIARGTESQKIKFTSNAASPQPGDWGGIYFGIKASDESIIEHALIEYCGRSGITISDSNPTIKKCVIRDNLPEGILIVNSKAEVSCCDITNNNNGITVYIDPNYLVIPTIINNNIFGNISYGIQNPNNLLYEVNAEKNWWGHASGPGGVAQGSGDPVSSGVNYDPWLTYISTCTMPNNISIAPVLQLLLSD